MDDFVKVILLLVLLVHQVKAWRSPIFHLENGDARYLFCSQTHFDSLSFDGQMFRFTVGRHVQLSKQFISPSHFVYDEFRLQFHPETGSFRYYHEKIDLYNVVPRGGFYIDQLGLSIEFYQKLSVQNSNPEWNLFRCHQIQQPSGGNTSNSFRCSDFLSQNNNCKINLNGSNFYFLLPKCLNRNSGRLFPPNLNDYLKKYWNVAFLYDPVKEKPMYIFTNRTNPFMVNSIWILQSLPVTWLTKPISPLSGGLGYRYKGGFNWKTALGTDRSYLLVEDYRQRKVALVELIDNRMFVVSSHQKSWKIFFGCQPHLGAWDADYSATSSSEYHQSSSEPKRRYNRLAIYILVLCGTILVCTGLFLLWNMIARRTGDSIVSTQKPRQ